MHHQTSSKLHLAYRRRAFMWSVTVTVPVKLNGQTISSVPEADDIPFDVLDADTPLMQAGFTSLMTTRLASELRGQLPGIILSPLFVFDFPTPRAIATHLSQVAVQMPPELDNLDKVTAFLRSYQGQARAQFEGETKDALALDVSLDSVLESEKSLDPAIMLHEASGKVVTKPRIILLTGGTGYLGTFLLAELLMQTTATIHCLVRAENAEAGKRRIEDAMAQYDITGLPMDRCIIFIGDMARENLGLTTNEYLNLVHTVDAIWHNGAKVDHVVGYQSLRAANVKGTVEILKLAVRGRVKPVHFVSTYATCFRAKFEGYITEDMPLPSAAEMADHELIEAGLMNGYTQSKWVAEQMVLEAASRGIPVTIHKPGRIFGSLKTGACNSDDLFTRFMIGCVQLGSAPLAGGGNQEYGAPVDQVARSIVALGLESHRTCSFGQSFFELDTDAPAPLALLLALGMDYDLKLVKADEWLETLRQAHGNVLLPLIHEIAAGFSPREGVSIPAYRNPETVAALKQLDLRLGPSFDYNDACKQLDYLRNRRVLPQKRVILPEEWLYRTLQQVYDHAIAGLNDESPASGSAQSSADEIACICMACDDDSCDFKAVELQRRPVGPYDVHIEVVYCGVCHSDLSVAAGHTPAPTHYPLVPGHEAVGRCVAVGPRVKKFKVGDHIGVGNMVDSCLECRSCLSGEEQGCAKQVLTYNAKDWSGRAAQGGGTLFTAGGYSTAMVVHERFCILIPPGYPLEHAGPIMCAGTTMYDPMKRAGVQAGTEVGILGLGGLGVMGIKLAKALGCTVTAISRGDAKRALALGAGADHYINSKDTDQMSAHMGRLSLIINTIPSAHDASIYNPLLTSYGHHIHTGLHSSAFAAGATSFLLPGRTQEKTTFIGGVASTQEVMDLCASAGIMTEIELRPVTELNRIFELLDGANESGKRFVIDIAGTLACNVSTAPVPRLNPSPLPSTLLREIAEAIWERLSNLINVERREETGLQTHRRRRRRGLWLETRATQDEVGC
tara:strand:+ start:75 stop:3116 length:3042 start_codon:yes stop_codon:yes gene_type:complete